MTGLASVRDLCVCQVFAVCTNQQLNKECVRGNNSTGFLLFYKKMSHKTRINKLSTFEGGFVFFFVATIFCLFVPPVNLLCSKLIMASDEMFSILKTKPEKWARDNDASLWIASIVYRLSIVYISESSSIHRKCNKRKTNKLLVTNERQRRCQKRRTFISFSIVLCWAGLCFELRKRKKPCDCVCGYAGRQASCLKSSSFFTFIKVQQRADIIFVYISPT